MHPSLTHSYNLFRGFAQCGRELVGLGREFVMLNDVTPARGSHSLPPLNIGKQNLQSSTPLVTGRCEEMRRVWFANFRRAAHRRCYVRNAHSHVLYRFKTGLSESPFAGIQTGVDWIESDVERLKV